MRYSELPELVRFMIRHAVNGMAIGAALLLIAIRVNLVGLGDTLASDSSGLATGILFFQTSLTFGAVWMGGAVMLLGDGRE